MPHQKFAMNFITTCDINFFEIENHLKVRIFHIFLTLTVLFISKYYECYNNMLLIHLNIMVFMLMHEFKKMYDRGIYGPKCPKLME